MFFFVVVATRTFNDNNTSENFVVCCLRKHIYVSNENCKNIRQIIDDKKNHCWYNDNDDADIGITPCCWEIFENIRSIPFQRYQFICSHMKNSLMNVTFTNFVSFLWCISMCFGGWWCNVELYRNLKIYVHTIFIYRDIVCILLCNSMCLKTK